MSNSKNFNHVATMHGVVAELLIAWEHVRKAGEKLAEREFRASLAKSNADLRAGKIVMRHGRTSVPSMPSMPPMPDSMLDLMDAIEQQIIEIGQL